MKYLNDETLTSIAAGNVSLPTYDRSRVARGVVHFGPGAFHRAHQACYLDDVLHQDPRWGITEVALQSSAVRDALEPQAGLYTIAVLDAQPRFRVIGAIRELLVARESPSTVLDRLADPSTTLVTATITEKGYCLSAQGGLDFSHPDIRHDLQQAAQPKTLIGYLVRAFALRRQHGRVGLNVVSCDNLAENGKRLRRATLEFARAAAGADLERWIDAEVRFPCTMVDSITPATDEPTKERVRAALGVADRWPVQREAFYQWVIDDTLRDPLPAWEAAGVTVTNDVGAFERAKLRVLNGSHSTLAYLGSLAGYTTVYEAISDATLSNLVQRLMREDFKPTLRACRGLDLDAYIAAVLARFGNPAVKHLLAQIAWDGSQKLRFRVLNTMVEAVPAGRPIERLCIPLAAWFHFVRRKAAAGEPITDPMSGALTSIGQRCSGDPQADVREFLSLPEFWPADLVHSERVRSTLESAYGRLEHVRDAASLRAALR